LCDAARAFVAALRNELSTNGYAKIGNKNRMLRRLVRGPSLTGNPYTVSGTPADITSAGTAVAFGEVVY
jgi:hypothetical protein